jgi:hypothetical protein
LDAMGRKRADVARQGCRDDGCEGLRFRFKI